MWKYPAQQKYYNEHREEYLAKFKEYHKLNKSKQCEKQRKYYWANREKIQLDQKIAQAKYQQKLRTEILIHYGNGEQACVKCGFSDDRALSLDHINGGGNKERRQTGVMGGITFYRILKKQGFPEGYQTLCMNCQFIKRHENNELKREVPLGFR